MAEKGHDGWKTLGVKLKEGSPFISQIAVRRPAVKDLTEEQAERTVYLAGLPLGVDDEIVQNVCTCFGGVDQVALHQSKVTCIVVFDEAAGAAALLKAAGLSQIVEYPLPEPQGSIGLKAWVQEHKQQRPGNKVLQKQLDDWMEAHEQQEEARRKAREAAMSEDGWTMVVRGKGRKRAREAGGVSTVSGGVALAAAEAMLAAQKEAKAPVVDFYRFQRREQRRSELLDLRSKFEQDKKKVAEMRAGRNFKPF